MAHIASNNNENTNLSTITPFMDQLTHGVIKETSKNLRYYIDVKRRENAFVLNPNSSSLDSVPLKARFIYGTTKEYPPLYGSCHSDNDVKVHLRSFHQKQRKPNSTSTSPEKQMCREELNFHMRSYKYSPRESQKFNELRLRPSARATSSCSRASGRDFRGRLPKSAHKIARYEQSQLVDDAADILSQMIKTRRTIYEANFLSQQMPPIYVSRNANPSPRQIDDQSHTRSLSPSATHPSRDLRLLKTIEQPHKQKHTTENHLEQAASIMHNAKPVTRGLLCDYKISVTTGNRNGASTNAPIRIRLFGTNGRTEFYDLVDSETHRVPFLKGQTDVFIVQTDHVGQLAGISIGHDRKDPRSGWFLNKVSINDPIRDITYEIPCNEWLASESNDKKTLRDFQIASMVSHKKQSELDESRKEKDSQSVSSSTTNGSARSESSHTTNSSQNDHMISHHRTKKHKKQQRVSIGPTTVSRKSTSLDAITNHLSQHPPPTTVESHYNPKEFSTAPVPTRRIHSPIISSSSSSDTEIENNVVNPTRSTTPTPSPTFDQSRTRFNRDRTTSQTTYTTANGLLKDHSTDDNRPPARLEKRHTPISVSPERPIKNKEETNDEIFSFFE